MLIQDQYWESANRPLLVLTKDEHWRIENHPLDDLRASTKAYLIAVQAMRARVQAAVHEIAVGLIASGVIYLWRISEQYLTVGPPSKLSDLFQAGVVVTYSVLAALAIGARFFDNTGRWFWRGLLIASGLLDRILGPLRTMIVSSVFFVCSFVVLLVGEILLRIPDKEGSLSFLASTVFAVALNIVGRRRYRLSLTVMLISTPLAVVSSCLLVVHKYLLG